MCVSRRKPNYADALIIALDAGGRARIYGLGVVARGRGTDASILRAPVEIESIMICANNKGTLWLLVLLFSSAGGQVLADTREVERLLEAGSYDAAYEHAVTLAPAREGDAEFDFLLGMAAVKSGHLPEAVFAFERVLIAQPENHRARLELARVYFLQKDYQSAKTEFLTVRAKDPPDNVRKNIDIYLAMIDKEVAALTRTTSARISVMGGHDSNINSSTDTESLSVPALGTVILNEDSREISDQFSELNIDGAMEHRLNRQNSISARLGFNVRDNLDSEAFDTATANMRFAYHQRGSAHRWQLPVHVQHISVDGVTFRRMVSVGADYATPVTNHLFSVASQVGSIDYPGYENRDVNFINGGLNWKVRFRNGQDLLSGGMNLGYEDPQRASGANYGRRYGALQLAWQRLIDDNRLYATTYLQSVEHTRPDTIFMKVRRDRFYQLALGYTRALDRHWAIDIALLGTTNDSNIVLYDYDRVLLKGGLSYVY